LANTKKKKEAIYHCISNTVDQHGA